MNWTAHEVASGPWIKLREHYEAVLVDLRKQNDAINLDEKMRSYLVGRIHEVKTLLKLDPKAKL